MILHFVAVLNMVLFVGVSSETQGSKRNKRMAFDFPTNANGETNNENVNRNDEWKKAPMIDGHPPDLDMWSDSEHQGNDVSKQTSISTKTNSTHPSNAKTPTETTTTTPSRNYREDCPPDDYLCSYLDPCDPNTSFCAMDLKCRDFMCVDIANRISHPVIIEAPSGLDTDSLVQEEERHSEKETSTSNLNKRGQCLPGLLFECVNGYCEKNITEDGGITFSCVCDKGWSEKSCDMPCTLDCVHGNCWVDYLGALYLRPENVTVEKHMKCNCQDGWVGRFCHKERPDLLGEAKTRTLQLGLSLGILLFVVLVLSCLVLFVLWRKRVIVVMKLVYYLKEPEDGDGRSYDAYISMGTSKKGLEFVKNELCPMLENYGFKLYVQARDQQIGEALTESIHKAMEQSRRTILIVTPDYLDNEWSKFECIIAQIETLKLHQRIIPIVLEDISGEKQNMNKTLKHILASVKCLKFPNVKASPDASLKDIEAKKQRKEERFWKRLQLTMPKKRNAIGETHEGMSDLEDSDNHVKPISVSYIDMYSVA